MGSCSSVEYQDDMHLVIVGGGYGGSYLAVQMMHANICKVTLIDPRDAMFHSIGALRGVVDEEYTENLFLPYEKMLGSSFVRGMVINLDSKRKILTLKDGTKVNFTHLVIATGSRSNFPANLNKHYPDVSVEEAKEVFKDYRGEILTSTRIVIVGGGAVGVELAGEIKTEFPDKEVKILSSGENLVSGRTKSKFQKNLSKVLRAKGISVIRQERASNMDELIINRHCKGQILKTENGFEIVADLIIPCTGSKINNDFFKVPLANSMNKHGALKVNKLLQVKGHEEAIWALGDVTDVDEEKMAYYAQLHADVLVANFKADTTNSKRKAYKPGKFVIIVPVGRYSGVGQLFGVQIGNSLVRKLKGGDMIARKTWQNRGLELPGT